MKVKTTILILTSLPLLLAGCSNGGGIPPGSTAATLPVNTQSVSQMTAEAQQRSKNKVGQSAGALSAERSPASPAAP